MSPGAGPGRGPAGYRGRRTALWLTLLGAGCSVYTPDLLTGSNPATSTGGLSSTGGSLGEGGEAGDGAGGVVNGGGGAPGGGSGGQIGNGPFAYELIDDMEDDNATVLPIEGRNGHWDSANDGTPGGEQTPAAGFTTMHALPMDDRPHEDSNFSAYMSGSGFTAWGAFLNVSMRTSANYETTPTYDLSGYVGLSFYAKAGPGTYKYLRVRYVSGSTDPRGQQCSVEEEAPVSELCFDHYYRDVTLNEDWTRHEIFFSDFQQAGVGKEFPSINLEEGYGFEFYFGTGGAIEFWVDDLAFVLPPAE